MNNRIITDIQTTYLFLTNLKRLMSSSCPAAQTLNTLNMLQSFTTRDMQSGLFLQVELV